MNKITFSELSNFTEQQRQASKLADRYLYFLFGGRRGVLKSYWLRWYLLKRLLKWYAEGFSNVNVMLCCEDYPSLIDRQVNKITAQFPPWLGEVKNDQKRGFGYHLRNEYGGGSILFRNLDKVLKYKSVEVAGIGIDELTLNPEFAADNLPLFDVLRGSLRWPGIKDVFFAATSNPDGIGRLWVRRLFVEVNLPDNLKGSEGLFKYMPGQVEKQALKLLNAGYWKMLETLGPELFRAWVEGDWYVSFSGVVFGEFSAANILTDYEIVKDVGYEWAVDDGYFPSPRVILFIQKLGARVIVFDEIYALQELEEVTIARAREVARSYGFQDEPDLAICSDEDNILMSRLRAADVPARSGSHVILEGISNMRGTIKDAAGVRQLYVHARCVNLIREMTEGYRWPNNPKPGDKPLDEDDHGVEALRKWLWARWRRR